MVAYKSAIVIVLTELVDPENEKPLRRKTREWIKSRRERERERVATFKTYFRS